MIEFIEKDGELFRKVEPYPLTEMTTTPCLVKLISDDSPMGRLNRNAFSVNVLCEVTLLNSEASYITRGMVTEHISRFEVVAEHCPEGGVHWALWQMKQGKKVKRLCTYHIENEKIVATDGIIFVHYTNEQFINRNKNIAGWVIYEPELFVGHWYYRPNTKSYVQYTGQHQRQKNMPVLRLAGKKGTCLFHSSAARDLVYHGPTLEPDFSNAKEGDEAWHYSHGKVFIERRTDTGYYPVKLLNGSANWFTLKGKYWYDDTHPTVFHSFEHFLAYHKEAEYQRKQKSEEE